MNRFLVCLVLLTAAACTPRPLSVYHLTAPQLPAFERQLAREPAGIEKQRQAIWLNLLYRNRFALAEQQLRRRLTRTAEPELLWALSSLLWLRLSPTQLPSLLRLATTGSHFQVIALLRLRELLPSLSTEQTALIRRRIGSVRVDPSWTRRAQDLFALLQSSVHQPLGPSPSLPGLLDNWRVTPKPVSTFVHLDFSLSALRQSMKAGGLTRHQGALLRFSSARGIFLATTARALAASGTYDLRVDSRNPLLVSLRNGSRETVLTHLPARGPHGPVAYYRLPFGAGAVQIAVLVANRTLAAPVTLNLRPSAATQMTESPITCTSDNLLWLLFRGELLLRLGAEQMARRCLQRAFRRSPGSDWVTTLYAMSVSDAPLLPASVRHRRASALWKRVVERAPGVLLAVFLLAQRLGDAGLTSESVALYRRILSLEPSHLGSWLKLHEYRVLKGWIGLAQLELRRGLHRFAGACALRTEALSFWFIHGFYRDLDPALKSAHRCAAVRAEIAGILLRRMQLGKAASLFRSLIASQPDKPKYRAGLAKTLLLAGDLQQAARTLGQLIVVDPAVGGYRLLLSEIRFRLAQPAYLRELKRLLRSHHLDFGLFRSVSLLLKRHLFSDLRVSTQAALAAVGSWSLWRQYAAVIVLKHRISRFLANGDEVRYVHHLVRVQNKAGIDAFGEVDLPDGADVLRVRTVLPDGQVLLPEESLDKESFSMPGLVEGALVEYAYIVYTPANRSLARSRPERFLVAHTDYPVITARLDVVAPETMRLVSDNSAALGVTPSRANRADQQHWLWQVRHQKPIAGETESFIGTPFLPWIRVQQVTTLSRLAAWYAELIMPRMGASPSLTAIARQIARRHHSPAARLNAAFRWVCRHITQSRDHWLKRSVPHVLALRKGHRLLPLMALLRELGIRHEIVLVRPKNVAPHNGRLATLDPFSHPVVRAVVAGRTHWLSPIYRWSNRDYLLPGLSGQPGIAIGPGGTHWALVTPERIGDELRESEIEIWVEGPTSAHGRATERVRGVTALLYRHHLSKLTKNRQLLALQRVLNESFPNIRLTRLRVQFLDEPHRPLLLSYSFRIAPLDLSQLQLLPENLYSRYGKFRPRSLPLVVTTSVNERTRLRIHFSPGKLPPISLAPLTLRSPFGELRLAAQRRDGELSVVDIQKRLVVRAQVIAPRQYAAFVAFLRAIGNADRVGRWFKPPTSRP